MDVEYLSQFNKRLFKKFLGVYVQQRRIQLELTTEQLSEITQLSEKEIKLIEVGRHQITHQIFDTLRVCLELDPNELINIGKITQVQNIMNLYKEIDEHYPR